MSKLLLDDDDYERITGLKLSDVLITKRLEPSNEGRPRRVALLARDPKPPDMPKRGYVYLLRTEQGYYKIGMTENLKRRMGSFRRLLPFPVDLVHSIDSNDAFKLEQELHKRFADKRGNGEWFNLSPEDVEYIRSL